MGRNSSPQPNRREGTRSFCKEGAAGKKSCVRQKKGEKRKKRKKKTQKEGRKEEAQRPKDPPTRTNQVPINKGGSKFMYRDKEERSYQTNVDERKAGKEEALWKEDSTETVK